MAVRTMKQREQWLRYVIKGQLVAISTLLRNISSAFFLTSADKSYLQVVSEELRKISESYTCKPGSKKNA